MTFDSVTDKIDYLIEHDYLEEAFIRKVSSCVYRRTLSVSVGTAFYLQVLHGSVQILFSICIEN